MRVQERSSRYERFVLVSASTSPPFAEARAPGCDAACSALLQSLPASRPDDSGALSNDPNTIIDIPEEPIIIGPTIKQLAAPLL